MWTEDDKKFLRSMRITADAPPPRRRRFHVEPAAVDGCYRVVDKDRQVKNEVFGPQKHDDPRAAAQRQAAQLNAKHDTPKKPGEKK